MITNATTQQDLLLCVRYFRCAQYGTAIFSTTSSAAAQFVYGGPSQPLVRQPVEGSGFTVALRIMMVEKQHRIPLKGFN